MNSVIITDYGAALGKTADQLGWGPRLEPISGWLYPPLALTLEQRFTWNNAV